MAVKDYLLFLKTPEGRWILQVPHVQQNSLKLGINFDEGNGDPRADKEEAMRVFMTAKNYFDKVASKIYQHWSTNNDDLYAQIIINLYMADLYTILQPENSYYDRKNYSSLE